MKKFKISLSKVLNENPNSEEFILSINNKKMENPLQKSAIEIIEAKDIGLFNRLGECPEEYLGDYDPIVECMEEYAEQFKCKNLIIKIENGKLKEALLKIKNGDYSGCSYSDRMDCVVEIADNALDLNPIRELDNQLEYTWDVIIEQRKFINQLANILDVRQDYLIYQSDFLKGITKNNKKLSVSAINKAIDRINELLN